MTSSPAGYFGNFISKDNLNNGVSGRGAYEHRKRRRYVKYKFALNYAKCLAKGDKIKYNNKIKSNRQMKETG